LKQKNYATRFDFTNGKNCMGAFPSEDVHAYTERLMRSASVTNVW